MIKLALFLLLYGFTGAEPSMDSLVEESMNTQLDGPKAASLESGSSVPDPSGATVHYHGLIGYIVSNGLTVESSRATVKGRALLPVLAVPSQSESLLLEALPGQNFTIAGEGRSGYTPVQIRTRSLYTRGSSLVLLQEPRPLTAQTGSRGTNGGEVPPFEKFDVLLDYENSEYYRVAWQGRSGFVEKTKIDSAATISSTPVAVATGPVKLDDGGVVIRGVPGFLQYGRDPFSASGASDSPSQYCGPTSLQMVLAYHGKQISRDQLAEGTADVPGLLVGGDTDYERLRLAAVGLGYANTRAFKWGDNATVDDIREGVEAGRPQIVRIDGRRKVTFKSGHSYTLRGGHLLVVTGFLGDGSVVVNDPNYGYGVLAKDEFFRIWKDRSLIWDIKP